MANIRKRKMEPSSSASTSTSGGDISGLEFKIQKRTRRKSCIRFYPEGHISTVFIGNVIPKSKEKGGCSSSGDMADKDTSLKLRSPFCFSCKLGDQWKELYAPGQSCYNKGRRRLRVGTGDHDSDVAITRLARDGYLPRLTLSKGKLVSIILCSDTSNSRDVAIKIIKSKIAVNRTRKFDFALCCGSQNLEPGRFGDEPEQVKLLRRLHHPNIVNLFQASYANARHIMILEFCPNGNLEALLQSIPNVFLSEHVSRRYLKGLSAAVQYLHNQMYAHCAISCENVLLDAHDRVKLAGFGSVVHCGTRASSVTSLPPMTPYQAPEIILKNSSTDRKKSDVWSLCILLYRLLTGHFLYGPKVMKIPLKALVGPMIDSDTYRFTVELLSMMQQVLVFEPEQRPSMTFVCQHPWLQEEEKGKVTIGLQYLVRRPQRGRQSTLERTLKQEHGI